MIAAGLAMHMPGHSTCAVHTARSCKIAAAFTHHFRQCSGQASNTKMVDDMVAYVRTACQGNTQQALDVLKTGLAHQEGTGHDRLQLTMAEVHAANSNWAAVVEHALPVARQESHAGGTAQMQMEASLTCVRALLTQGNDVQATQLAQQAAKQVDDWFGDEQAQARQQAHLEAATSLASAFHATGDSNAAAAQCSRALSLVDIDTADGALPGSCVAAALKQVAALRLAQGQLPDAEGLFERAGAAAEQNETESSNTNLRPMAWQQQVAADVMLGAAQTAAAQHAWDKAEELLSKALSLAEQLGGGGSQTPQVGVVLGLLGNVYARSKRITLAEGLHRQAVKLLKLDPSAATASSPLPVHSSLAAAAAYRYSQLLHALPRRDTEASLWKTFAAAQTPSNTKLDRVLGPLDILKGGKDDSTGVVVDLQLLRSLPCW